MRPKLFDVKPYLKFKQFKELENESVGINVGLNVGINGRMRR